MSKILFISFFLLINTLTLSGEDTTIIHIAKQFNLYGGEKATIQWRRIFSSERHLKRYHLQELDQVTRDRLERYLIQHAADSDQPIVPGIL